MMKETPEQHRAAFIKQLKSTRLFNTKPTTMSFDKWRSIVKIGYVGMVGDLFHAEHLDILQLAKLYCQLVVVGVLGDGCEIDDGSVVTRSVKPYAIMAGSPAVTLGMRQQVGDEPRSFKHKGKY